LKKKSATWKKREADKLFSLIIRSPGFCTECGTTENLQCAHGFSRRYRSIRWNEANAFCLCRGCHMRFTHRPLEWDDWIRGRWGDDLYAWLRSAALDITTKVDVDVVLLRLQDRHAEI